MASHHRSTWFVLTLIVAGAAIVVEGGWLYLSRQAVVNAEIQVKVKRLDLRTLENVRPTPKQSVAQAIRTELNIAEGKLALLQESLSGGSKAEALLAAKIPLVRTDAYFDLIAYVQAMRALAIQLGVTIGEEERFGFFAYANEGPELDQIPLIFRQRQILAYLLETLFASGPRTLNRVLRSAPDTDDLAGQRVSQNGRDYFLIPSMLSVQKTGFIDTLSFRIEFSGETTALRKWLNQVAKFDLPLVVRSVEVGPSDSRNYGYRNSKGSVSGMLNTPDELSVPLVSRGDSDFTVTIEYVELVAMTKGGEP